MQILSPNVTAPPAGDLPIPSKWPGANARLLGVGAGLPVHPLDRLANFGDKEFERFVLEWAGDYLVKHLPEGSQIQWRGGAGDKGRDVIALLGHPSLFGRPWKLFQCKHYADKLGPADATTEIGKIIYYSYLGDYSAPVEVYFVTHKGVTNTLQDLIDNPENLRTHVLDRWNKDCKSKIKTKELIELTPDLEEYISRFDFSIFRVKQPLELISEHQQTRYHPVVFGVPLIDRPPPPAPPSQVKAEEAVYVRQLFDVISEQLNMTVEEYTDFSHHAAMRGMFDRSRLTFYCAEGLKELARDQMEDETYFSVVQLEFAGGLYFTHLKKYPSGFEKMCAIIENAVQLQLSESPLKAHVTPNDRVGICHHLANARTFEWCAT